MKGGNGGKKHLAKLEPAEFVVSKIKLHIDNLSMVTGKNGHACAEIGICSQLINQREILSSFHPQFFSIGAHLHNMSCVSLLPFDKNDVESVVNCKTKSTGGLSLLQMASWCGKDCR